MQVILRVTKAGAEDRNLYVPPGQYEIGRAVRCHFRLEERSVSRQHCLLRVTGDAAFVRDLGSRNGTAIRSQRIAGEEQLVDGDHLIVGPYVLVVQICLRDCYDVEPLPPVACDELGITIDGGRTERIPWKPTGSTTHTRSDGRT
jgi:pSer/pThr/pTyr-binding forkhead associated (FHA) protein